MSRKNIQCTAHEPVYIP